MALYEGIALIQEKQAVVLDLGTDYTKFGFTGEAAPRCIVRSQFWCARRRRSQRLHDYSSPQELHDNLVHMLHLLYFRHVLVNPKERKVVVVESLFTPTLFRETLAEVLFLHYEVAGVIWADSGRLAALTLGAAVVLVINIGARETEVTPVVHGSCVVRAVTTAPGAAAVHAELERLLLEDDPTLQLEQEDLEDIKVKTCFVIDSERAEAWRAHAEGGPPVQAARSVQCRVRGRSVHVSGRARELAAEPLFPHHTEGGGLADAALHSIALAPLDARRALAGNVLVTGGGAALPGLTARLQRELRARAAPAPHALPVAEFRFHRAPAPPSTVAWCGAAAALAAAEGGAARLQARDQYVRERRVRDWCCLLDNTPPDHPCRDVM